MRYLEDQPSLPEGLSGLDPDQIAFLQNLERECLNVPDRIDIEYLKRRIQDFQLEGEAISTFLGKTLIPKLLDQGLNESRDWYILLAYELQRQFHPRVKNDVKDTVTRIMVKKKVRALYQPSAFELKAVFGWSPLNEGQKRTVIRSFTHDLFMAYSANEAEEVAARYRTLFDLSRADVLSAAEDAMVQWAPSVARKEVGFRRIEMIEQGLRVTQRVKARVGRIACKGAIHNGDIARARLLQARYGISEKSIITSANRAIDSTLAEEEGFLTIIRNTGGVGYYAAKIQEGLQLPISKERSASARDCVVRELSDSIYCGTAIAVANSFAIETDDEISKLAVEFIKKRLSTNPYDLATLYLPTLDELALLMTTFVLESEQPELLQYIAARCLDFCSGDVYLDLIRKTLTSFPFTAEQRENIFAQSCARGLKNHRLVVLDIAGEFDQSSHPAVLEAANDELDFRLERGGVGQVLSLVERFNLDFDEERRTKLKAMLKVHSDRQWLTETSCSGALELLGEDPETDGNKELLSSAIISDICRMSFEDLNKALKNGSLDLNRELVRTALDDVISSLRENGRYEDARALGREADSRRDSSKGIKGSL